MFYDGYVVIDSRNIAPEGWHVPTDEEWTILIDFLGGEYAAAEKLRETGYTHWLKSFDGNPFPEGTNESGFTALPAGMAGDDHRGWEARFHTSSMVDEYAKKWVGPDCTNLILRASTGLDGGMPIRLIKD